jgi:S-adenosylmethionine hydrolase
MTIIGLLTDFGLVDSYVAEMKAVVLSICPEARLVDISHGIRKFDVRMGEFVLMSAAKSFPEGSIFLAVVDPGVGSERMPLIVQSKKSLYVGPDNGLLMLAAAREGLRVVYRIEYQRYVKSTASATFHGRDLFAHVVGDLANGVSPSDIGSEISDFVRPSLGQPIVGPDVVRCEVLHIDDFGNIITDIDSSNSGHFTFAVEERLRLLVGRRRFGISFVRTYDDLPGAAVGCLFGSHGFLEIAMKERSAAKAIGVRPGSKLTIRSL